MKSLNFDVHFKDLFDSTSDLIHFVDIEGKILKTNPAWLKTLEYGIEEVLNQNIFSFISPASHQLFKTYRDLVISKSGVADIEFEFVTKSGSRVIVEGQVGCVYDQKEPVYTRGVFRNVTAKRETEETLIKHQRRLQTFIENAPSAVVIINEQQIIQEWNPKAEEIFDFSSREVVGQPMVDIIIPQQFRAAHLQGMSRFLKTGEGQLLNKTIEVTALHKSGHEFPISLNISSVKIDHEWLFIAFITDITKQKALQEEIIRQQVLLLQVKNDEEKKDQFISMASHELKTPLTSLKAFVQLLERNNSPDRALQLAGRASGYVRKLEVLIGDLLDVSKIKADKINYHFQEVNFKKFLEESIESVQLFTVTHRLEIEHCDDACCFADVLRLEQVIHNLLTNAIKYSPGANRIIVSSRVTGNELVTSVQDFGIGIAKEHLDDIFSRFYRVDNADMKFQGLGIGLFITKEIVERHSGNLWVVSEPGKGTVFNFSLPISKSD